ncbi:MAG TPA: hypothetical protein VE011_01195 [Candidatus Dormibacteraeota bacterium]|nr:hypothetical protein [Candidatus Dormibacteraeota bacterium]
MIALPRRFVVGCSAMALAAALIANAATVAHGPDPLLGTTPWGLDQVVGYQWKSGATPPSWMAAAIDAGAADVRSSKGSRAATFIRVSSSSSEIAYGGAVPCSSYGIACMNRTGVPSSFDGMWFRPYGWAFDWGTLRWCQGQSTPTTGCYDAENVALDEFGHIELLGHHQNLEDESDFQDAVVQYAARSKPRAGWDQHAFGRCDVARLQLEYALESSADRVSTCLSLATSLSVVASATTIDAGSSVRITGTFKVAVTSAAKALSGDPLSGRTITLQRRLPGATSWSTFGPLGGNSTAGSYGLTLTPSTTYDYRLLFTAPGGDGLLGATSATVRIAVIACPTTPARGAIRLSPCL